MEKRRRAGDRRTGRGRVGLVAAVLVAWALGARPAHAGRDHHFGPRLDVWLGIPPVVVDPGYQYDYGYGHYPRGHRGHHHYGDDDSDSDSDSGHRHHRDCR